MLVSIQDCADALGVAATDTQLIRLVTSTDAWVKHALSREFERKSRIEVVRGFNHTYTILRESPIRAITEVRIDATGQFLSTSIVSDLTLFTFDSSIINDDSRVFYRNGCFPTGLRVAQFTYEAGWWPPSSGTLSSLTSASTTATATTSAAHGLVTGQPITISNATPSAYNGTYTITVTDSTHFTYTFAGGTSPATGTITYAAVSDLPSDLTERLIERVAAKYKQGPDEEMKRESQGDRNWEKFQETDARILAALSRYRRVIQY